MPPRESVWPVLIVNGRVLMLPDFLMQATGTEGAVANRLLDELYPGNPPVKEIMLRRTFSFDRVGEVTAYFRWTAVPLELLERVGEHSESDSGRVQKMIEGIVIEGDATRNVDEATLDRLRAAIMGPLERYFNNTSAWPAPQYSSPLALRQTAVSEARRAVPGTREHVPITDEQESQRLTARQRKQGASQRMGNLLVLLMVIAALLIIVAALFGRL